VSQRERERERERKRRVPPLEQQHCTDASPLQETKQETDGSTGVAQEIHNHVNYRIDGLKKKKKRERERKRKEGGRF